MRVLVVEDAWRLAEAVAEILRGEGWSADVATDGGRGAELAAAGAYDCVLLDVMLPVMGGLDVLRGMREAGDATPVILVTARDAVPDRVAGLDAGADDYLVKPFHAEELLARVRAVCRRPRAIEEAGPLRALGLELDEGSLELRAAGG
ncbi:response regulator, partial [Collinsella aerofaciens]